MTTTALPRRSCHRELPAAVETVERERRRDDGLSLGELGRGATLAVEGDLPDEQPQQAGHDEERDRLSDALRGAGHARTMKTGVPTSTCSKSHSTWGMSIRMHPCEAE